MRFILTGVADTTYAEKSSLYILDCNNSNGSHFPPAPSPSWRGNEMAAIPENRISTCSRTSLTSTDSRVNYPQSQPQAINANVVVSNYPQRLSSSHSYTGDLGRHSYEGGSGVSRQSFHSNSSSSMGSLDVLDESGVACNVNVAELYQQGMTQSDIIYTWLSDMRYEAYLPNFVEAGYDMPTISRMTPEDLTAIGITKPGNRKKLTREISKLNIPDGIPDYLPGNTLEWLQQLGLDEYYEVLEEQNYNTMDAIQDISWEDLEEIGIHKLGHQKKIMLAIERFRKIMKRRSQGSTPVTAAGSGPPRWSADMASSNSELSHFRSMSGDNVSHSRECSPYSLNASKSVSDVVYSRSSSKYSDIVPIQLKSGLSRSSSGNSINSSSDYAVPHCQSFTNPPERGGTPPSSEDSGSSCSGSMHRSMSKKGPVKGIHGLPMSKHNSQDSIEQRYSMEGVAQYATLRRSGSRKQSSQSLDFNPHCVPHSPGAKSNATSPALGSLPSPFANFRSPYAQIQSGEVKNQLNIEKRSSSVPSSPVTKSSNGSVLTTNANANSTKKPPAPPKRTMSMKTSGSVNESSDNVKFDDDQQQDFPPPLPPVAFSLEAMKGIHPKSAKTDYVGIEPRFSETRLSPARDSLKLQSVTESNLAARRRAGSAEKEHNSNNNNNTVTPSSHLSASSSSIGSARSSVVRSNSNTPRNSIESIPFANDNMGTIKQKGHDKLASYDELETNMEDALESEDNSESDFEFDTVKRVPRPVMMTVQSGIAQNRCDGHLTDY